MWSLTFEILIKFSSEGRQAVNQENYIGVAVLVSLCETARRLGQCKTNSNHQDAPKLDGSCQDIQEKASILL